MNRDKLNRLRRWAGVPQDFSAEPIKESSAGLGTQVDVGSTTSNPDSHVMPQLNKHELDFKGDYENEEETEDYETDDEFKKGDHVYHNGEERVVVIADAKADFVGVTPVGQEHDVDAVDLVHAKNLEKHSSHEEDEHHEEDNMEDGEYEEDEYDDTPGHGYNRVDNEGGAPMYRKMGEADKDRIADVEGNKSGDTSSPLSELKKLVESMHHHSNDHYPETYADAKSHREPVNVSASYDTVHDEPEFKEEDEDYEMANDTEKVHVPGSVLSDLKGVITACEQEAEKGKRRDDVEREHYYADTAKALQIVHDYLSEKTIEGLKRAQLLSQRMMNVSRALMPDHVWKFIVDGGKKRSLKDYHTEVKGYPIVGPRNTLDDNN